jgi:hypothetical protein
MRKYFLLFLLFVMMFFGACSSKGAYKMSVSSITALSYTQNGAKNYTLKPMSDKFDSLYFARYSQDLDKELATLGYQKVFSDSLAQEIIYVDYGVNESSKTIQPNLNWGFTLGSPWGYRHPFFSSIGYDFYNTNVTIIYNRYLTLVAKDKKGESLWRVDVSSYGESNKIAEVLPKLIEGATPYIGKNLKNPINIVVEDKKK